jgi:hypothetical protein
MGISRKFWLAGIFRAGVLTGFTVMHLSAEEPGHFGFLGPEIFPVDPQINQLKIADLDGDGLNDIIVVNNARSKIHLLYNQTGKTNSAPKPTGRQELNELPPDARFKIQSIASEKRISSLVVEDLNGDGRPDLAYYGEPRELIVIYNEGSNHWSTPHRWELDDGQLTANALCSGDLNGDHRQDLILLGENQVYFLAQKPDHTLAEPQKIPFTGSVRSVQVVDIDGDGLSDLLLVNWEERYPFRFRLQKKLGELGPEVYFLSAAIRSYWADNLEISNKTQIITISQNSGRAQVSEFVRKPAEKINPCFQEGQLQVLPLSRTDKARRGMLWADVDGDGLPDLIAAEPESGQISIALQQKDGSFSSPKSFPALAGVTDLAVADWDGDGKPDIFMLSADERQVAVTRLDDKKKLPFPTLIPVEGRPLILAVGKLQPQARPTLAIVTEQDSGNNDEPRRYLVTKTSDGKSKSQRLGKDFKARPTALAFHDANQDGLIDLILLSPYEKVKVLLQTAGKDFDEVDVAAPGGALEQPWLSALDIDGDGKPELLLTQRNFVRAVVLKQEPALQNSTNRAGWTFSVKEQINGAASSSRLIAAAAVSNCTNGVGLFLLDAERKTVSFCEREKTGIWDIKRNTPMPIWDFSGLQPLTLANGQKAIGFLGLNAAAIMPLSGSNWELNQLDGYETPIKDGHLNDVVSGDLDSDGRKDLVFLETARNYLDLVIFDAHHKLIPANRWQVFEERTFRSRRSDLPEPREAAVADVTGDGKNDLIVLVHDRILVYPQE